MKVSYSRNAAWVLNSISTLLCIFHFCVQIVINNLTSYCADSLMEVEDITSLYSN